MFDSGQKYSVPTNVNSRLHRLGFVGPLIHEPLESLGVVEATHFASVSSGDALLFGRDKDSRLITFVVDSGTPGFRPLLKR